MAKKLIRTLQGDVLSVDTSDEACGVFGVRHGDAVTVFGGKTAIVEGVAPADGADSAVGLNVLWCALDCCNGKACYAYPREKGQLARV